MAPNLFYSELVLVVTAAVLLYVAFNDLRRYQIRNDLIAVLGILFFIHALVSGRWISAHWNIVLAAIIFTVSLMLYSRRLMGGGDVKLLTVAFLWVGFDCALPFAVLLLGFVVIHALAAKFGWAQTQLIKGDDRKRIPFGPSIAAALAGVFALGCLAPTS